MSSGRQGPDVETTGLIEKLRPLPERDRQAAANGRSKFLAEAQAYGEPVSAARGQRHMERKENAVRRWRIPTPVVVLAVIALVIFVAGRFFLNSRMLMSRSIPSSSQSSAEVFVAGQNIPVGAVITEDELATISLPQDKVMDVEFTVREKDQLVGRIARYPLGQGVVITSAMVAQGMVAAAMPPPSNQALSIPPPQHPSGAAAPALPGAPFRDQMVIKNADIRLLVDDTNRALEGVTQLVTDAQGYTLSSRVWYQDYYGTNYKWATLTIGVPADQFENALRRLRSLGVRVLDETASGEDVTDQYVDLKSQETNLEATRDRIKAFLDQAKTVDEALRINQQLSDVEAQVERIKGQMNYLWNRAAFSMITINLEPDLPQIVATPTVIPTATPIAALGPWDASGTTRQATYTLVSAYRLIAQFLIWLVLVVVPVLGPPAALIWLVAWLLRRRKKAEVPG